MADVLSSGVWDRILRDKSWIFSLWALAKKSWSFDCVEQILTIAKIKSKLISWLSAPYISLFSKTNILWSGSSIVTILDYIGFLLQGEGPKCSLMPNPIRWWLSFKKSNQCQKHSWTKLTRPLFLVQVQTLLEAVITGLSATIRIWQSFFRVTKQLPIVRIYDTNMNGCAGSTEPLSSDKSMSVVRSNDQWAFTSCSTCEKPFCSIHPWATQSCYTRAWVKDRPRTENYSMIFRLVGGLGVLGSWLTTTEFTHSNIMNTIAALLPVTWFPKFEIEHKVGPVPPVNSILQLRSERSSPCVHWKIW